MANMVVSIDEQGTATYLVNEYTRDLFPEAAEPRRASHVEPVSLSLRKLFRWLREAFGEDGRVGNWTRTWTCLWLVDMRPINGDVWGPFASRAEAIEFEVQWLNRFWLGR
jgi:hypothetical protein